jgi:two-component system response regulator YesN
MNIKKDQEYEFPDPVKAVMDFVEQNYFRRISLEELAAITFLNPFYLLKLFKKHTGYTPGEYINKFRIEYSKKLLVKPEMTIEQIALFLGFNTHSYFSKIFRQSTGLTPAQFRKMYLR